MTNRGALPTLPLDSEELESRKVRANPSHRLVTCLRQKKKDREGVLRSFVRSACANGSATLDILYMILRRAVGPEVQGLTASLATVGVLKSSAVPKPTAMSLDLAIF